MSGSVLSLPRDIPWKLLAVSPDMMDTDFCDSTFPYRWRSSLAVSAFEPSLEDLPDGMCDERVTFLRVTSTITGYQPSEEETRQVYLTFPDVPTEELNRIIGEYFACYGVLLHVAVFPGPRSDEVETRERVVVDFVADAVGVPLTNPLDRRDVRFEQPGQDNLEVVDLFPPGGDSNGELSLRRELAVTVPKTDRVEATVFHAADPVTMEAFAGGTSLGSQETGPEQDQVHRLTVDGNGIDQVVFRTSRDEASLLELAYYATTRRPAQLSDYPHIVDFEPKTRDLYQAATETGEILTASVSSIATDKTLTHTETSETGLSLSSTYESPKTPDGKGSVMTGSWSHKWGETDTDSRAVGVDASRERRERQGSATNISQLYNLLTGYHVGTNRAMFLMLPRPHVLQPTDRRTFVQGLRVIEGVQEYFLVVTRPKNSAGMSIEVVLETGHFPETVTSVDPPEVYKESSEDFEVTAYARGGHGIRGRADTVEIESDSSSTYLVGAGWVVDKRPGKGDDNHPGVSEIANDSDGEANSSIRAYNYQATDNSVQVSGRISGSGNWGSGANFKRTYRVHLRSEQPIDSDAEPEVVTPFLITGRGICVRYRSTDDCPVVIPPGIGPEFPPGDWVIDEVKVQVASLSSRQAPGQRLPLLKETLRQIQFAMARSARMPSRRPFGRVGFLECDYFGRQIAQYLPQGLSRQPVPGIRASDERLAQSELPTVHDLMTTDLSTLERRSGLPVEELVALRRAVIGLPSGGVQPERDGDTEPSDDAGPPQN